MLPLGLAGCAIATHVIAGRIPADMRTLAIGILGVSVAAGGAAVILWLSDGLLGSFGRCAQFVGWLVSGRSPACWNCGGAGRNPIRSTVGLASDYTLLMLIMAPAMWFLLVRLEEIFR